MDLLQHQLVEESSVAPPSSNGYNISNNIVPQSEYQAALAAIESTFENFHRYQQDHDKHRHPDLDHDMIEGIYKTAKQSLLHNVSRIVRPIEDNEYSDYVDQYHIVLNDDKDESDDEESVEDSQDREKGESKDNSCKEEYQEEKEEIDEEELIDKKALKNAQRLRTRIRSMSSTVKDIRERVLKRTEDKISSSISDHLIDIPIKFFIENDNIEEDNNIHADVTGHSAEGKENIINLNTNTLDKSDSGKSRFNTTIDGTSSSSLQDSFKGLSQLLRDPRWLRLPSRINSLQDTIETIQKETSEDRFVSQTEIAITSQCKKTIVDESSRKLLEEYNGEEESNFDPMDRLALLGQYFS